MANGPTQSGRFSDPGLTDVQWQLLDSLGAALTPLAPPDRNGGGGNYLVTPVYPPGYQYGFIRWVSAAAGLDYEDVCNLDAPVPLPPAPPVVPDPSSLPYATDALGRLTLPVYVPGAGDALTLTDGNGTVVYQGAGLGVATTINLPLDPGALPGGPDSPGQVVAWTWDLSGVPSGLYTGSAAATGGAATGGAATGGAALAVTVGAVVAGRVTLYSIDLASDCCLDAGADRLVAVTITGTAPFAVTDATFLLTDWAGQDAGGFAGPVRAESAAAASSHTVGRLLDATGLYGRYLLAVLITCDDASGLPQKVAWDGVIGVG